MCECRGARPVSCSEEASQTPILSPPAKLEAGTATSQQDAGRAPLPESRSVSLDALKRGCVFLFAITSGESARSTHTFISGTCIKFVKSPLKNEHSLHSLLPYLQGA